MSTWKKRLIFFRSDDTPKGTYIILTIFDFSTKFKPCLSTTYICFILLLNLSTQSLSYLLFLITVKGDFLNKDRCVFTWHTPPPLRDKKPFRNSVAYPWPECSFLKLDWTLGHCFYNLNTNPLPKYSPSFSSEFFRKIPTLFSSCKWLNQARAVSVSGFAPRR